MASTSIRGNVGSLRRLPAIAIAIALIAPGAAGAERSPGKPKAAKPRAKPLKETEARGWAQRLALRQQRANALATDSGVRACVRVTAYRRSCSLFVVEDRPNGFHSCDWTAGVKRTGRAKLRAGPAGEVRCRRPNLAVTKADGWFAHAFGARVDAFDVAGPLVQFKATAFSVNAHASVGFYSQAVIPGRRYSFTVVVDVRRKPAAGQAAWFVWVGAGGSGIHEWMGTKAPAPGRQTLTVTETAPPGAATLLCVVGNGGPSRDGRNNVMNVPESSELRVDPATAVLLDDGRS